MGANVVDYKGKIGCCSAGHEKIYNKKKYNQIILNVNGALQREIGKTKAKIVVTDCNACLAMLDWNKGNLTRRDIISDNTPLHINQYLALLFGADPL